MIVTPRTIRTNALVCRAELRRSITRGRAWHSTRGTIPDPYTGEGIVPMTSRPAVPRV